MAIHAQDGVLGRLRRHQYLLINGGGLLITAVVLLAGALELWAGAREYLAKVQDETSIDARRLSELSGRMTSTLRNNVQNIELSLKAGGPVDAQLLQRFREGDAVAKVQATPDAEPVLVIGDAASAAGEAAWPYLRLAQHMSPAVSIITARNSGQLSAYLHSADRRFLLVAVAPWPGADWQRRLIEQRAQLMERLRADPPPDALGQGATPRLRWLPPRQSPLTGRQAIPITTSVRGPDGQAFGTLTFELPAEVLAAEVMDSGFGGDCLILDGAGQVVMSCQGSATADLPGLARQSVREGLGQSHRRDYRGGLFLYGWALGQNGWTLVYTQSWRNIASGISLQLMVATLAAGTIILLTWVLLALLRTRVLAPAVRQSEQVFESEQLSRTLIETAPVGLALLDSESGAPLLSSPAMVQMQAQVRSDGQGLPHELLRRYRQVAQQAGPEGAGPVHEDMTFATRDAEPVSLSVSMAPARYRGRDVLVAAFVNVTDKKLLERQLLQARDAADRANAAKSSFLAAMSHEIRTPLNAILGNLELLAHSAPAAQRDRLETIRRSSNNLLSIVSDVLDFSKIEAGELRLENIEFDALEVAANALAIFTPVARAKGLLLCGELGETAGQPMRGDPTRLAQVLNNLLSNALKFTERGQVTLRATLDASAAQLHMEVEDTGIGMSPEQVRQVFRAFSQADETITRRYGGTGLGLTLCMRLIQAMGGALKVRSEAGRGSVFRISLPLGVGIGPAQKPAFEGERVLVLAALPSDQAYLRGVLQGWGLRVDTYQHPAQLTEASLAAADALVLWGERLAWHPSDEARLLEESSWVIDCRIDGPREPVAAGHVLNASAQGLKGLACALLQAFQGQALPAREVPREAPPTHLRVLVAEDNEVNRRLMEEQLQLIGCTATLVEDGQRALACLEREPFDVLLTDLAMPGMDGYALARQARARWPRMPVVAATANATLQEQEACEAAGITRVLTKPLSLAALETALCEVCGVPLASGGRPAAALPEEPPVAGQEASWLGGRALPADVQRTFEQSCRDALAAIRQALEAGEAEPILAELHSLRGAFGVFGLQALAEQAAEVDGRVRAEGARGAAEAVTRFCEALEACVLLHSGAAQALLARILELAAGSAGPEATKEIERLGRQLALVLTGMRK
ncbi:ATP-binding protein [Pseudomonas citronellolis]|uniref:ATP-binding protein n=1 Tax=Pseudomonas citronellolis TaxID=53408 RepID=UPI00226E8290|nr:ATP-binding protein [Pseudomonas citronellolis]WAB90268.1 ATP-binding protein [Pseudomonas citronellolis]